MKQLMNRIVVVAALCFAALSVADQDKYLPGGPLAGLRLPLFQGQHGEEPGYPGCIPELLGKEKKETARAFANQGQAPEVELYPGAEEHWRGYWFKYCPQRSIFDLQSQLRNFTAPDIKGAGPGQIETYAAPVYWVPRQSQVQDSGRKRAPVPVVRLKVGAPVLSLELGKLPVGLYALRVIAAVPTAELRQFRKPVYLRCTVNDGPKGAVSEYKLRAGYCDEFYSTAEFYFHASEERNYQAEISMDAGSEVDLLVRNISLDDCLAGTVCKALKTSGAGMPPTVKPAALPAEERLARDAAIWNYLPPPNHQGSGTRFKEAAAHAIMPPEVDFGVQDKDRKQLHNEIGLWTSPNLIVNDGWFTSDRSQWDLFLVRLPPPNAPKPAMDDLSGEPEKAKPGAVYTLADMLAYRPLPDPFPYKDNGTGLYFVNPQDPGKGRFLAEQGMEVTKRFQAHLRLIEKSTEAWRRFGDSDAARDAAIALARYAYVFPAIESGSWLCNLVRDPGAYGRNLNDRRRETEAMFMGHYGDYLKPPRYYDELFDFIRGNEDLAASIRRFVPWVKNSGDVVRLLDTYLVQTTAKRIMRYHYYTEPMGIANMIAVLGEPEVSGPWWDWLFSRTFIYPLPPSGIQDLMILGHDRSGAQFIGSTFYAQGEGAQRVAANLDGFKQRKLLPAKYDLTSPVLYPKPLAHCYWQLGITVAGLDFPRIGDVCGPDKSPGNTLGALPWAAANGWKWSADPAFAWCLKNANDKEIRKIFSDADWAAVEKAAATLKRAPWLDLRSRQVYNWMGVLEAGTEDDDPLRRRAAYLRTGLGIGHDHADTLDLQYCMFGMPMTVDGGQRPGYTVPVDNRTRVHNMVEVDGGHHNWQSWVSVLSDGVGARYLRATAVPAAEDISLYQRGIALIDVDAEPVSSYVFDVFRVAGGKSHVYGFHGPVSDEVVCNAAMAPVPQPAAGAKPTEDQEFLKLFKDVDPQVGATAKVKLVNSRFAGTAGPVLETTWRYSRDQGPGSEQQMLNSRPLGNKYDEKAPRKFTRLHLFDTEGARVYRADSLCFQWNYRYVQQMVRKDGGGNELQSAFVALHEPYAGEPFIAARRLLDIPGNDSDARKAVAAEVKLKSGRADVLFADGHPEKTRQVRMADGAVMEVAAEFAFTSRDAQGLRMASLTGGTLLKTPDLEIQAAASEYVGTVTAVDYLKKQLRIDKVWPAFAAGGVFEIGTPARTTSYTLAGMAADATGTDLTTLEGADYYRSGISQVNEETGFVQGTIKHALGNRPGLAKDFTASNDARTKFWRADMISSRNFQFRGAPVKAADFGPENVLRLWEYGVGDTVRQSTFVHLRRLESKTDAKAAGQWEVMGNVDVKIILGGNAARIITAAEFAKAGGKVQIGARP